MTETGWTTLFSLAKSYGFWGLLLSLAAYYIWTEYKRRTAFEPGTILIHDVDSEDFSRLFAKALLDSNGRKVLLGLMQESKMNFTPREAAILQYTLGEIDRDTMIKNLKSYQEGRSAQEAIVFTRQLQILNKVLGTDSPDAKSG